MQPTHLDGQVAIITGAARGQGRAHAVGLAALGATIVACDVPRPMASLSYPLASEADLDETVKLVEADGGTCRGVVTDVRDGESVDDVVRQTLDAFGRIDILVANAGIVVTAPLSETSDEAWDEIVATNLTGVFRCIRAVLAPMREQGYGRVVVTSSMGGRMGLPNLSAYNATKWGLIGMAKSVALEVAAEGITVNVVCPCTVGTPMVFNDRMYKLFAPDVADPTPEDIMHRFRRVNPIPRPWLEPEDVTRAVVYLVTDPGVLTGSVLEVGLGSSARIH